jgi:hypothetical protein
MCPFCLAMAAQIAVGVVSTGGAAALMMRRMHLKNIGARLTAGSKSKEDNHVS